MEQRMITSTALLLIAHGSRRSEANADLEYLAQQFRDQGRYFWVQPSYLELCEPSIREGGIRCVEQGATKVILVPYFLSPGIHVREDLTQACTELSELYPHVAFLLAEPLGRHPLLLEVVAQRALEVEKLATK